MAFTTWVAIEYLGVSPQGQALPLYLRCSDGLTEIIHQCKLDAHRSNLYPQELATEYIGNRAARLLGLSAGDPKLVTLSSGVQSEIEILHDFQIRTLEVVGIPWAELTPFFISQCPKIDGQKAAKLLALDIVLANGDRTDLNPNLAHSDGDLFVFDFEHCLELPGTIAEDIFATHIELIPNFIDSHVFGSRFAELRRLVLAEICDIHLWLPTTVPPAWETCFKTRQLYLEYLKTRKDDLMRILGGL